MTNDLRTIGRAMREAQRKYYGDSDEHSPGDLLATELAFDKALEAAPAPQGDNAALIERLRRQSGSSHTCLGCDDEIKAEAAAVIERLAAAIEALVRDTAAMTAMCDSYADENQRLHDRAEKAERERGEAHQKYVDANVENPWNESAKENAMKSIMVDGIEYVPASVKPAGNRAVVVVDRGWIFAGDVTRENGRIRLSNALHVFKWESVGFAGMIADTKNAKADLRPIADVDIPEGAEVFCVPVPANWGL